MTLDEFVNEFKKRIKKGNIVVFTGAGISTKSGIKDFRGKNGLYKADKNIEYMFSRSFFQNEPEKFYNFFKDNMIFRNYKPNKAHLYISKLEKDNKVIATITQNIDGLDKLSGNKNVIELHGNANEFYCSKCHKEYTLDEYLSFKKNMPICNFIKKDETLCAGVIRPNIVLYEEALNENVIASSIEAINKANTLLVLGSSLLVTPARNLVEMFIGKCYFDKSKEVYIVNIGKTPFDNYVGVKKYDGDIIDFINKLENN